MPEPREIYDNSGWAEYRSLCAERTGWFDGSRFRVIVSGGKRDPYTKELPEVWPLRLNPIARFCYTHQAVLLGVQPEVTELPITTLVNRSNLTKEQQAEADDLEGFMRVVWEKSAGLSTQSLAALRMQYLAGHAFQIAWKPYATYLPHRIEIISHDSPSHIWPISWTNNGTRLLDCYVGYEISKADALIKFGVRTDEEHPLYLEHWTENEFEVSVGGKAPVFKVGDRKVEMRGENPWGVVPIVYIPHFPRADWWGSSLIDGPQDLRGLAKELNSRMADKGDAMQEAVPVLASRNVDQGFTIRQITRGGQVIRETVDLGGRRPFAGAGDPDLFSVAGEGLPESAAKYPQELWDQLLIQGQVASVALGMDDVSGGRITGPVTAYRMLPTLHHTTNERLDLSQGMVSVANIVMSMVRAKMSVYKELGVTPPTLPSWDPSFQIRWRPTIPIEDEKIAAELNERLKVGGISLQSYLIELGCQDPEREIERIWEERQKEVDLQIKVAEAQAQRFNEQGAGNGQERNRTVRR